MEYKPLNKGSLKAFVDIIDNDGLILKGLRVIHEEGKDPWVGFPQSSYQKNGKTKYAVIIVMLSDMKKEVCDLILEAYRKHSESK
jgi:DNA-binding cell septation regulator SpoVG